MRDTRAHRWILPNKNDTCWILEPQTKDVRAQVMRGDSLWNKLKPRWNLMMCGHQPQNWISWEEQNKWTSNSWWVMTLAKWNYTSTPQLSWGWCFWWLNRYLCLPSCHAVYLQLSPIYSLCNCYYLIQYSCLQYNVAFLMISYIDYMYSM